MSAWTHFWEVSLVLYMQGICHGTSGPPCARRSPMRGIYGLSSEHFERMSAMAQAPGYDRRCPCDGAQRRSLTTLMPTERHDSPVMRLGALARSVYRPAQLGCCAVTTWKRGLGKQCAERWAVVVARRLCPKPFDLGSRDCGVRLTRIFGGCILSLAI